jgi:hypothetical protein
MKRMFFVLFSIFTLVVLAVITANVKQDGSKSPPDQNVTVSEDVIASVNTPQAATIINSPTREGCVIIEEEVLNINSSDNNVTTTLAMAYQLATREGCCVTEIVYSITNQLALVSDGNIRQYYCTLKYYPAKIERTSIKTFYA